MGNGTRRVATKTLLNITARAFAAGKPPSLNCNEPMKKLLHTPGLILIAFCGLVVSLIGWEAADDWLMKQYLELRRKIE